jgi:hypothetical protein
LTVFAYYGHTEPVRCVRLRGSTLCAHGRLR